MPATAHLLLIRQKAGVKGRWHDNRHTLVTELAESGAGDEVIMSIAGHVSRAMLSRRRGDLDNLRLYFGAPQDYGFYIRRVRHVNVRLLKEE